MIENTNFFKRFVRNKAGIAGLIGVSFIVLLGLLAPFVSEYPKGYGPDILVSPSFTHIFGTDNLGLDVFAQILWGTRTSLFVSATAVLVALIIGLPLGLLAGYKQGKIGSLIDIIIDVFLTLPVLPLMIVIAAIVGSSIVNVAIVIGVFAWPTLARVARNATLKVSQMQYIEAAKCLGFSNVRIVFKHILLNILGPVLVNLSLIMASAVLSESGLSFLGLSDPTVWSWGTILKKAWDNSAIIDTPNPWWWWLIPSIFIAIFVISFNLFGTAINETINPKENHN